jgi:hypothetical protein
LNYEQNELEVRLGWDAKPSFNMSFYYYYYYYYYLPLMSCKYTYLEDFNQLEREKKYLQYMLA